MTEEQQFESTMKELQSFVNGIEAMVEKYWNLVDDIVLYYTQKSVVKMKQAVNEIPDPINKRLADLGYIDFTTTVGKRAQLSFFRKMSRIYDRWHTFILQDLGMAGFRGTKPWDKSLGLFDPQVSQFSLWVRKDVADKALKLGEILTKLNENSEVVAEAIGDKLKQFKKTIGVKRSSTKGLVSARLSGKGLRRKRGAHSRTTSIILGGLKGVVQDQEKALWENTLRGLDLLPRNHANKMYDAATGITLRDALNTIADEFSTGNINTSQLKLSIQTHIRAMMRRIASDVGVKQKDALFIQVPPTRQKDVIKQGRSSTVTKNAYLPKTMVDIQDETQGSGNSLGRNPGDVLQIFPIPKKLESLATRVAKKLRKQHLATIGG